LRIGLIGSFQKVPKFDIQSQFSTSKMIQNFLIFFFIKEYEFRSTFFELLYFLKWCPCFDSSPLIQFSKFNNFIWLQLIFSQKPFQFCFPLLKTPQPVLPYWATRTTGKRQNRGEDTEAWNELGVVTGEAGDSICTSFFIYAGQQTLLLA
jgi:hypothetical protein